MSKKSGQLKQKVQELKKSIEQAEKNKKEIIGLVQNALKEYQNQRITLEQYKNNLSKLLQNKSAESWIQYYNNYISLCQKYINFYNKEIKLEKLKLTAKFLPIIFLLLTAIILISFLKPQIPLSPITTEIYTQELNLELKESTNYEIKLKNLNEEKILKSLKISGTIEGKDEIKIYFEDKLILDSSKLNEIKASPELEETPSNTPSPNPTIQSPQPSPEIQQIETITTEEIQIEEIIKEFLEYCEQTCDLSELKINKQSYILKIEIVGEIKLNLKTITYEIQKEEKIQEPTPIPSPITTPIPEIQETLPIILQSKATINRPIKWIKKIEIKDKKENEYKIEIPKESRNIEIKIGKEIKEAEEQLNQPEIEIIEENQEIVNPEQETGIPIIEEENKKIIDITEIVSQSQETEFAIIYITEGPTIREEETSRGKRIIISGPDDLQNILAFTEIPEETPESAIHLYQIINDNKIGIPIIKKGNQIEWIIPHLSEQIYELEIIILNIQSYPAVGGNWEVRFTTKSIANLTIRAINDTTWSNENENNDLKFLEIKCGENLINYEWINNAVFIKDYECNETAYEINKVLTPGRHELEFDFGGIKKYAHNLAGNNRIRQIIHSSGITSGAITDITISPTLSDISKAFHFISYRHNFANDHADTFRSSEIINPSTLRIYGDSTGGNNPINFEYTIIEFDSSSPINVQRSTRIFPANSIFPLSTTFTSVSSLVQTSLIDHNHNHNADEGTIGCEEFDRVRLTSTTSWELNIGCSPNSGPQENRVEIVDWNDPSSIKNIQRGTMSITDKITSVTITPPTPIDPSHTLLFVSLSATSQFTWTPREMGIFATINSLGQIVIERQFESPGTATLNFAWELVEYHPAAARVQHLTINSITGTAATATITQVDTTRAIALGTLSTPFGHGNSRNSNTINGAINTLQFTVKLQDSTTIQVQRGTASGTSKIGVQVLDFTNNAPIITDISDIPDQTVTESGITNVQFFVIVSDQNGVGDLNDASLNVQFIKDSTTRTGSCVFDSNIDSTTKRYSCTIGIQYFDMPGTWTVSASIQDLSGLSATPYSETFILLETACITLSPSALSWPTLFPTETDKLATNNPITVFNTCNKEGGIRIRAFDLLGETNPTYTIPANSFTVHTINYCDPIDAGTGMAEATETIITGTTLPAGDNSIGDGQEQLYFCIEQIPEDISAQFYSATGLRAWEISIALSALLIKRKKKKKSKKITEENIIQVLEEKLKERYNINIEELLMNISKIKQKEKINIPLDVFKQEIAPSESLCKYLKENKSLTFKEISKLLNRDQRTIWINYNNAIKKKKEKIIAGEEIIPIEIFSDRRLSILESLIYYLKERQMKNIEIAKLLYKDSRNIYTLYSRAIKKLNKNKATRKDE